MSRWGEEMKVKRSEVRRESMHVQQRKKRRGGESRRGSESEGTQEGARADGERGSKGGSPCRGND